jgi:DNA-binding YbaB/EbfC family protein
MKNFSDLMKQAQAIQQKFTEAQERLGQVEAEGQSGGGMVRVTVNGKGMARRVQIDPSLVDPKDVGMLEDLLVAAMNDAKAKIDLKSAEEMQKLTGGLPLPPGLKL